MGVLVLVIGHDQQSAASLDAIGVQAEVQLTAAQFSHQGTHGLDIVDESQSGTARSLLDVHQVAIVLSIERERRVDELDLVECHSIGQHGGQRQFAAVLDGQGGLGVSQVLHQVGGVGVSNNILFHEQKPPCNVPAVS